MSKKAGFFVLKALFGLVVLSLACVAAFCVGCVAYYSLLPGGGV